MRAVLLTNPILDLFTSNSSEPSRTIKINPTVPNIGNVLSKFGMSSSKKLATCLAINPNVSNNMTEGILVLDALMSNMYANKSKTQNIMIVVVIVKKWFYFRNKAKIDETTCFYLFLNSCKDKNLISLKF